MSVPASHHDSSVHDVVAPILFVPICFVLGIASRQLLRGTKVPYTIALLLLGIGLGSLGSLGYWVKAFAHRCIMQMVLLAGPGVVISTFFLGAVLRFCFPYDWNWKTSLLLGGLLSATDPVAVVALLKELGASKKLNTIIEGESLMNDGTAIVVYRLFFKLVIGESFTVAEVIKFLSQITLGAVALGFAFGLASFFWLGFIFNDTVIEITLTLAVSYLAYFTAENGSAVSGVLTVMTLGMFYAAVTRTAFKGESQQSLRHFWELISYIANTIIFILSGVVIAESILHSQNVIPDRSWAYLALLYVFLQVSRVVVVAILYPGLKYFGYGLDLKEAIILIWSGLRGAVALYLSLILNRSSYSSNIPGLTHKTGALFVFFTGGIVFLTLIINGSTTQFLLHLLGMDKSSEAKKRVLVYTSFEMQNKALEAFQELPDDEELGPADWPSVVKYLKCLKVDDSIREHPHKKVVDEEASSLLDTRLRLLNGVQAAYWGMLEEGRITQTAAFLLTQSVDEAIDAIALHKALFDWKGLEAHVQLPRHFKYMKMRFMPKKLVTFLSDQRLELSCYICAAFLHAHRIARKHLHEFLGESKVAEAVLKESEAEGDLAKQFLQHVQITFPEVLRVVKTKQVTYSILQHLSEYVQNLEKTGLLDAKEMNHLHDCVQIDLEKLSRNPPSVHMPSVPELLSSHPFLRALPSNVCKPLQNSVKEMILMRETFLYREGSKADGIWLITNGVLKWSSSIIVNSHFLHPTISHGSTVGLYETLTGRPYLCELIADSVAQCFFIEKEVVLSAYRSTLAIEDFFWKESAIVVSKLLLPQQFGELSMQEMRILISEHSTIRLYLTGEMIEVRQGKISVLLEGVVKQEGKEEHFVAPSALVPTFAEIQTDDRSEILSHQGLWFKAQERTRLILIDSMEFQNRNGISRKSSSSFLSTVRLPTHHNYEHEGIVSLPPQHERDEGDLSQRLSEKSMQLSMFGSTAKLYSPVYENKHGRGRMNESLQWSSKANPKVGGLSSRSYSDGALLPMRKGVAFLNKRLKSHGILPHMDHDKCLLPLQEKKSTKAIVTNAECSSQGSYEAAENIDSPSNLSTIRNFELPLTSNQNI